jgi:muconolactone delta-isomerase
MIKSIPFRDRTQYSFWGNVDYATNADALAARNQFAKNMKAQGLKVRAWSLPGQTRKYSSLGNPDGTTGTVYYCDVFNV